MKLSGDFYSTKCAQCDTSEDEAYASEGEYHVDTIEESLAVWWLIYVGTTATTPVSEPEVSESFQTDAKAKNYEDENNKNSLIFYQRTIGSGRTVFQRIQRRTSK